MPVLRHLRVRKSGRIQRFTCNSLASGALFAVSSASTAAGALLLAAAAPATAMAAVTVPLAHAHPAYARAATQTAPVSTHTAAVSPFETVAPGDTLSAISERRCGTAGDWSGIFYANRPPLHDPDVIAAGQVLRISCTDPGYTYPKPKPAAHVQQPVQQQAQPQTQTVSAPAQSTPPVQHASGTLTAAQVGALWIEAGGPAWAEGKAEEIAYCESGYRTDAYNPSGATGLWQILGAVVGGNLDDPFVNAENAVAKFKASGDTFAQWVCQ